ncbi:thiolase family protein [Microbacterium sp.]|uniref:thiolase family protein n=1 Tax=Microbacterium sp. TaxID=51671 RepID=UPI0037CC7A63
MSSPRTTSARDAVIVDAVRTPIGRRNGGLSGVNAIDLAAHVLTALQDRTGIDPAIVDDVIFGCVHQVGEQGINIARNAVLSAGWPESVPATTVDRQCGSSQQSVHFAAAGVVAGHYDVVVAGGVESMSRVPMGSTLGAGVGEPTTDAIRERYGIAFFNQGLGAEQMAQRWGLTRTELDEFAVLSHQRAAAAAADGRFREEIAAVDTPDGVVDADEGIRPTSTVEILAGLAPAFREDGVIHAGNASQISDGASALLIMTSAKADELGLAPLARIHTAAVAGDDPVMMLGAPIPATRKVLDKAGLRIDDIDTYEVNEAFAPVPLAWLEEIGADPERLNPDGGAIALGHPLGASGARIMTTLVHRMRRTGARFGLQAICEGGGMANATILEAVAETS